MLIQGHSSRLAALDYTVCLQSEVFVTTQGGNFPHFLIGHRRYLFGGHSKTIKPDKRKLALLFDSPGIRSSFFVPFSFYTIPILSDQYILIPNLRRWQDFRRQMQDMLHHSDLKGVEMRKLSSSPYVYPMPDCMCKQGTNLYSSNATIPV